MKQEGNIRNTLLLIGIFLFLAGTTSIPSPAMAQTGIVAYYPFNGNANDESGNGNNGTVGGEPFQPSPPIPPPYYTEPLLTEDRFGVPNSAYIFDGNNDFIHVPDNSSLDITGGITLAAWIYPTEQKTQHIVRKGPETNPQAPYELALSETGAIIFGLNLTTVGSTQVRKEGGYALNQWTFVAGTYDGASMKLYVDGVLVNTIPASGSITQNDSKLLIGTRLNLPADTFKGKLDEIRIYNRALTSDEIAQRYISDTYGLIDPTKWADLEFIARIEGGALRSEARSSFSNPNISSNLTFIDPNNVTSIKADVTVTDLIYNGDTPRALIHGFFYNDGIGNVRAEVAIGDSGSGLRATYFVQRCPDLNCTTYTPFTSGSGSLGAIILGTTHTLFISWTGTQFAFQLDNNPTVTYNPQSYDYPAPTLTPPIPFKAIGTHVTSGLGGFVSALFDNVYINGNTSPYDDFSSADGLIDRTKWKHYTEELNQALEIVREQVSDGVFGMAVRGYGSFANNSLNLLNGQNVKELQADLTVEQFINIPSPNQATPMAVVFGSFYNAGGGGPGDSTGDIRALAGIRLNGTQPVGFYNIVQCTLPDCNIYPGEFVRLYYHEDPLTIGPDLVGKPHRVSISYNDSLKKFIFAFDGRPTVPAPSDFILPLPTRVGSPNVVRMGPLTRVGFFSGGLSGEGYVSAQFANIATVVDTDGDGVPDSQDNCPTVYNPIVAQWKDINGGTHNNSQPDFDLDHVGDACDLCPQTPNDGGPCGSETGGGNTSTSGPLITVNLTYTGGVAKYLVEPDCNNVVFNTDKPIPQKCRRIPPYVLSVLEEVQDSGLGSPGGDWKLTQPNTSWTISCNLQDIFDEGDLISNSPVKITPMYTFFDTDRGLDPAGNCVGVLQGDICVNTSQYKLFQGTIPAQEISVATTAFKSVPIDIKPGILPKTINLGSQGNVPVAILSTADFNATTVNPYTVKMGAAHVRVTGKKGTLQESISDVNGDGRLDMIVHFDTQALGLTNNAVEVCVSGETTGGIRFIGCNPITIVP